MHVAKWLLLHRVARRRNHDLPPLQTGACTQRLSCVSVCMCMCVVINRLLL